MNGWMDGLILQYFRMKYSSPMFRTYTTHKTHINHASNNIFNVVLISSIWNTCVSINHVIKCMCE